jgi:osmotically-inducible protein OsmY
MNKSVLLLLIPFFLPGCTTIGVGAAELTGVSLIHDRRSTQTIAIDEKIENDAEITLNLNSSVRESSHFNVTSYNRIVLVTGETPTQELLSHITASVEALNDVRMVKNMMLVAYPSDFSSRANDTLITIKVKTAFTADYRMSGFDATRIKVVTENGRVFLMGMVYPKEGEAAADIARQQPGVLEVIKIFEYI